MFSYKWYETDLRTFFLVYSCCIRLLYLLAYKNVFLIKYLFSPSLRVLLKFEQMHVLVPTYAFVQRCASTTLWCPRFGKAYDKTPAAIRWWRTSVSHIIKALKKPFFVWTKVHMVRLGKRSTNRKPLRLKKVTATFKPQKTKPIYT